MNAFDKPKEQYLRKLFDPKTIAVVGASPDTSKGGYLVLFVFLPHHGFTGRVYPVNPKYEQIGDLKCYPTVLDIPDALDAVMITLPENLVLGVLKDCLEKGVKLAIIRTAFEEFFDGDETKGQKKVAFLELIRGKGLRIMGPSSLGFVNVHRQIAAYFHVCLSMERLVAGNIGLVSQSGGLSGVIFNKAQDYGVGFSYFFSTGVETDLETADFIDFLVDDPDTKVISCFVEGFNDPQRILATFGKAGEANKPIIIMKIGRSELGMKAAKSHTGKMVGKDDNWNAIFKQKGIIRVETIDELVETCSLFAKCKNPRNDKIGIMAASGGAATILTDQMGFYKLNLPDLNTYTRTKLREILPSYASINNPLDVSPIGDEGYLKCLEIFSEDNNFGTILLPLTIVPEDFGAKRAREIVQFQKSIDKQLIILWLGGSLVSRGMKIIEESEIPLFRSETICVKALRAYKDYLRFQNLRQTSPDLEIPETDRELFEVFID